MHEQSQKLRRLIEKNISINSTKKRKMLIDVWELVDKNFIESYKWLYQKI